MARRESIEVIPAVLVKTFRELEEKLEFLNGVSDIVQIDITDGKFAGEPSWPLYKQDQNFEAIVREERGMPFWEDFDFEFDLMMSDPFSRINDFITAGAHRIVLHAESINLDEDKLLLDQLRTEGRVEVGIAFGFDTDEHVIREFLPFADFVQVMGIKEIGYQGQVFDKRALDLIKWLRQELPTMPISVDGGVDLETGALCVDAGATRLVSGHAILESSNPREMVLDFKHLI